MVECANCGKKTQCKEYREQMFCQRCEEQIKRYEEYIEYEERARRIQYESLLCAGN